MIKKLFRKRKEKTKTKKKKRKFSKIIIPMVIMLNALFAAATLYVFLKTSSEPQVLIASWFTFTTGELWMLSGIKKAEVKAKAEVSKIENNDNKYDYEEEDL